MDRSARPLDNNDHDAVRDWYRAWGMVPIPRAALPQTGRIVPGVCAGFLYLTNSCVGLIESYISNPEASKELLNEGLDEVTRSLIQLAQDNGVSVLKCESRLESVVSRAKRFGFEEIPTGKTLMRRF